MILGATGSLGGHVLHQALDARHEISVLVRTPSKLPPEVREQVSVYEGDLNADFPQDVFGGHNALINCAGHVTDADTFVRLVDRVVTSVDAHAVSQQPVCWFLAGAALLDIDASGRRGVDLPAVNAVYWPHAVNFARLARSRIDWRLLCPGPMVDNRPLGIDRMRISLDLLPVTVPTGGSAPSVSALSAAMSEMIVPYADAAALMLAHLGRGDAMSRHRVGLALPAGMRGTKP
jgi:putative NADH-flavin reductase